jgi:hypothetical protein
LSVDSLSEVCAALDAADSELVRDFGLVDAALESDVFLAGDAYARAVERWLKGVWNLLAVHDPDSCEWERE